MTLTRQWRRTSLLIVTAISTFLLVSSAASGRPSTGRAGAAGNVGAWNLARDFRVAPDQVNPNPDSLGNATVWYFLQSASLAHDPASYSLLGQFIANRFDIPGLESWQSPDGENPTDRLPHVSLNARPDNPFPFGAIDWPAGTALVHPLPDRMAVVGWRSPITGTVQVSGSVIDRQTNCGDGIGWSVDHGATALAFGSIPNGGSAAFANGSGGSALASIHVAVGDFLYFIVDSGPNRDHGCDSTGLDVTIS
jgi:hypothetical protein